PDILCFVEEDICYPQLVPFEDADYPDEILHGEFSFPVYYQLAPGEPHDGLTFGCSLAYLRELPDWFADWLVPGWLREKVVLLIKTLPKDFRIPCQPHEQRAADFVASGPLKGVMLDSLSHFLTREIGKPIEANDFVPERLPPHFTPGYWIGDEDGNEQAAGKDLAALRQRMEPKLAAWFDQETSTWEQTGLTHFPKDPLPKEVTVHQTPGFVALVDEGKSVGVRCYPEPDQAETAHRLGLVRLIELNLRDQVHYVRQHLPLGVLSRSLLPLLGRAGKHNPAHLITLTIDTTLGGKETQAPDIRDAETFSEHLVQARSELFETAKKLAAVVETLIGQYQGSARLLEEHRNGPYAESFRDIADQLDDLFMPGFLLRGWAPRLKQYPRYFKAMEARITRMLSAPPNKDSRKLERITPFHRAYCDLLTDWETRPLETPFAIREFGWQLQEFRIAVFAPEVGTVVKVSEKRLSQTLEQLS
ncbi:MAG: DUF3418 domain-containing protein, partial [Verrucomicrobiales bacterium]